MAGFLIAMISGALMSVQGVFNTDVTKNSSLWTAAGFVQLTALATCVVMWFVTGRDSISKIFMVEHKYALLGGVIGAFITGTVILAMSKLGVAKASLTIVITQVAVAYLIELLGLFGVQKGKFSLVKLAGIVVAVIGLCIFNMCGNSGEG